MTVYQTSEESNIGSQSNDAVVKSNLNGSKAEFEVRLAIEGRLTLEQRRGILSVFPTARVLGISPDRIVKNSLD